MNHIVLLVVWNIIHFCSPFVADVNVQHVFVFADKNCNKEWFYHFTPKSLQNMWCKTWQLCRKFWVVPLHRALLFGGTHQKYIYVALLFLGLSWVTQQLVCLQLNQFTQMTPGHFWQKHFHLVWCWCLVSMCWVGKHLQTQTKAAPADTAWASRCQAVCVVWFCGLSVRGEAHSFHWCLFMAEMSQGCMGIDFSVQQVIWQDRHTHMHTQTTVVSEMVVWLSVCLCYSVCACMCVYIIASELQQRPESGCLSWWVIYFLQGCLIFCILYFFK